MDDQNFWDLDPYNIETRGLPLRLDNGPLGVTMKTANIIIVVCSACALLVLPAITCYMGITTFLEGRRWRKEEEENNTRRKIVERERQAARMTKLATANAEISRNRLRSRNSRGHKRFQEGRPVAREAHGLTAASGRKEFSGREEPLSRAEPSSSTDTHTSPRPGPHRRRVSHSHHHHRRESHGEQSRQGTRLQQNSTEEPLHGQKRRK